MAVNIQKTIFLHAIFSFSHTNRTKLFLYILCVGFWAKKFPRKISQKCFSLSNNFWALWYFLKFIYLFFLIKPRNTHESSCERFLTNWIETTEHEMEKDENEKNHRMEIFSSRRWKFVSLTASTFFMCASRHDEHTMIFRCWKALSNILALTHKPMMFSTFFFFSFLSFLFCKYFPYSTLTLNVINLLLPSIFVSFNSSHIVVGVSSASNSSIYDFKVWLFFDFLLYCLQKSMT